MIYVMIYMSNWHYTEHDEVNDEVAEMINVHVGNGDLVMVADDLEYACETLKIEVDDLVKVELD